MELLRELMELQHERGWLDDEALREMAQRRRVPLYRLEGLVSFYPHFRRTPPPRVSVHVCRDVCCAMAGSEELRTRLDSEYADRDDIEICPVSCLGRCDSAPALCVNEVPFESAEEIPTGEHSAAIVCRSKPTRNGDLDWNGLLTAIESPDSQSVSTYSGEHRPSRWKCDPYRSPADHYATVHDLIASGAEVGTTCIERLKESELRGMGGAGFPTGIKWEFVAREPRSPKYVICNADESEPGTFKDRVILEELPHLIIEGMLLAGLTVGAEQGIVYLRHEYGREQIALERALAQAREAGVLGDDAAGSGQTFDIEIFVSPGGYILGEETALLEALEDKRGEPRNKPPYPGTFGLWGQPTLINNVESFALATTIIARGSAWWREQGHEDSAGLKFVSISGDVNRPGVYEIPLGTTVAELIGLAGGMREGRQPIAFLPGGASSNFLTADHLDTPLDFAAMREAGSMLGTGAVIVFGEGSDLFALATNIVRFFRNESCGKCVPCRLGTEEAVELLEGVQQRHRPSQELEVLTDLGNTLQQTSICGLGQVAIHPMLSLLERFPDSVPGHSESS